VRRGVIDEDYGGQYNVVAAAIVVEIRYDALVVSGRILVLTC